ncbi:hypothetical protein N7535_005566 [Penicillium sp. DV-2018c]|nr:hypothetical protein N7461_009140 [Penicillium sp. DV-2018c]KAJ5571906.1 hypothetical protein N7535_005566 [Penicillium sp. DV-2018c]
MVSGERQWLEEKSGPHEWLDIMGNGMIVDVLELRQVSITFSWIMIRWVELDDLEGVSAFQGLPGLSLGQS